MLKKILLCCFVIGVSTSALLIGADNEATITADQVVQKNIEARGGLTAWRGISAITFSGKMDAGSKQNVQLPFVMTLKRPRMSRLEIEFQGKKAIQVYDGANGWKVRPFLNRDEVESFTSEEMRKAAEQEELDGLLIDHEAKGIKVELASSEQVEGKDTYKLKLIMKNGTTKHLWVDAHTFLEVKIEGTPRRMNGKMRNVAVYYRNYEPIGGMKVPFVLETVVEGMPPSHKIMIDKVVFNPKLEDNAFAKPEIPGLAKPASATQKTAGPVPTANAGAQGTAK